MPRVSDINLISHRETPALAVRTTTSVGELPRLIGETFQQIAEYLGEVGVLPAGTPYVCYFNQDMEHLDVEIGFPVGSRLAGQKSLQDSVIPQGKLVTVIHRGPYQTLSETYAEVGEWISAQGLTPVGPVYESYLNGPEFPPEELLTQIGFPVR